MSYYKIVSKLEDGSLVSLYLDSEEPCFRVYRKGKRGELHVVPSAMCFDSAEHAKEYAYPNKWRELWEIEGKYLGEPKTSLDAPDTKDLTEERLLEIVLNAEEGCEAWFPQGSIVLQNAKLVKKVA